MTNVKLRLLWFFYDAVGWPFLMLAYAKDGNTKQPCQDARPHVDKNVFIPPNHINHIQPTKAMLFKHFVVCLWIL